MMPVDWHVPVQGSQDRICKSFMSVLEAWEMDGRIKLYGIEQHWYNKHSKAWWEKSINQEDSYQANELRLAQPDVPLTEWGRMGMVTQNATAHTSYRKNKQQSSSSPWLEVVF